jgi:hypothetical protein
VARKSLLIGTLAAMTIAAGSYCLGARFGFGLGWADWRPRASALLYVPPPGDRFHRGTSSAATDGAASESPPVGDLIWQRAILTRASSFNGRLFIEKGLADPSAGFQKSKWYAAHRGDVREMVAEAENGLNVRVIPGTALIEVSLRLPQAPDDALRVLQYMVDSYLQSVTQQRLNENHDPQSRLVGLRSRYKGQYSEEQVRLTMLLEQQQERQEERTTMPLTPAAGPDLKKQYEIEVARDKVAATRRRLEEIDNRLEDLEESMVHGAVLVVRPVGLSAP